MSARIYIFFIIILLLHCVTSHQNYQFTFKFHLLQKNSVNETVRSNENEDYDYEEWSKHFHLSGLDSENEDDYANEDNDFLHKEIEEGISLNCHEDYSKTRNSGLVGYSFHRTKILNFPDY